MVDVNEFLFDQAYLFLHVLIKPETSSLISGYCALTA